MIDKVIQSVGEFYGLDPRSKETTVPYCQARMAVYSELKKGRYTIQEIGDAVQRSTATVINGLKKHRDLMDVDIKYRQRYYAFMAQFEQKPQTITKEVFCETIDSIRVTVLAHENFIDRYSTNPPHIGNVIKSLLSLLRIHFPKDANGFCAISHYIYDCNFGKPSMDAEYETPDDLFNRLTQNL